MITYTTVTNPRYANAARTAIDVIVFFPHLKDPVPFTAAQDDTEEHGREIFNRAIAGDFGAIAGHTPDPPPRRASSYARLLDKLKAQGVLTAEDLEDLKP